MTLTPEQYSERSVKGHITRKLKLGGNVYDTFKKLSEAVIYMRESKSLSSIKEMYRNIGMTERAVNLITQNLSEDIIHDDDVDFDDTKFQQVLLLNENGHIPAGTWVNYEAMENWVTTQWWIDSAFDEKYNEYVNRAQGIKYTKRGREVKSDYRPKKVDNDNYKMQKVKIKSRSSYKARFIKDVTYGIIQNIHRNGSKKSYRTYREAETNKLVKVQHYQTSGNTHWFDSNYQEIYNDVDSYGYRKV